MSTIDTSTWSPDSDLNVDIGGIPLNADAPIQQTWQAIQMLMAALKGDTSDIKLTINQPDGTTIVATNQTLTVVDNGHAHTIANVAGLQTALNGKAVNAAMTGATASADGASGLVPKPEAGDQDKVLKGDGTWGTVSASSVAWSGVTSKPTTLAGYGITDAKIASGTITLGSSTITPLTSGSTLDATKLSGTASIDTTGNAGAATKLATARTISLTGDVSGSASFDGSANASITATVADDSHNHVISNVDGLQTALDGKISLPSGISNPARTVLCADGVWRDISQIAFPL